MLGLTRVSVNGDCQTFMRMALQQCGRVESRSFIKLGTKREAVTDLVKPSDRGLEHDRRRSTLQRLEEAPVDGQVILFVKGLCYRLLLSQWSLTPRVSP